MLFSVIKTRNQRIELQLSGIINIFEYPAALLAANGDASVTRGGSAGS